MFFECIPAFARNIDERSRLASKEGFFDLYITCFIEFGQMSTEVAVGKVEKFF